MSTIELNHEWVLCRSKCGKYKGYFKIGEIPPNYIEDNKIIISSIDFINHLNLIDTCFDRSWEQAEEYFKKINAPFECEFERVVLSYKSFKEYVISALLTDIDRLIVSYGFEYNDWYYIESILRRRDFFNVKEDNHYCIDEVLFDFGLPSLDKLKEYSTEQLKHTVDKNIHYFTLIEITD